MGEQVLRATLLLLASVPASSRADLDPKVMSAALLRSNISPYASASHALLMIENAIQADMRALQGPPLTELF